MPELRGLGRGGELYRASVAELRRFAQLALLTVAVLGASWVLASGAASEIASHPAARDSARVAPLSRALPRQIPLPDPELLRLGAPSVPLAVLDATGLTPMRAPRAATVAEALAVNGVEVGPEDRLSSAPDAIVSPGDIIRLTRVTAHEVVVRELLRSPSDASGRDAVAGRVVVASAGGGLADNTYRVEYGTGWNPGGPVSPESRWSDRGGIDASAQGRRDAARR